MNKEEVPYSITWLQEFTPYVNGLRVKWPDLALDLFAGGECTLTLDYEYSWLIGDRHASIALQYPSGKQGVGLVSDPPLGKLIEMAEGTTSLSWTIKADGAPSGDFVLEFAIPFIADLPLSPPVPGTILNLAQELEVKFDEFEVSFSGTAFPCHGAKHKFTVRPKPSSQLLNKPVKLLWDKKPADDLGVVVIPALGIEELLTQEGKTWELDCLNTTQKAEFSVQLTLVGLEKTTLPLTMSLAHNHVTVRRWTTEETHFPDIIWYQRHIKATSVFSGKAAESVPVNMAGSDGVYRYTNSEGEAATTISTSGGGRLEVHNRYDGTIV